MTLLGDLVEIKGGGTPSKNVPEFWNGGIPWASVKDFKSTSLDATIENISPEGLKNSASNLIKAGNIIVPTRMAVGKAAINSIDLAINQDLKALHIKDKNKVDRDYLFRFILNKSDYFESHSKGATVKGITLDVLRGLEIPLPPLEEQKRIAAILDKADALHRKREKAIALTDDLLRSVFLDMFGDPDDSWTSVPFLNVALSEKNSFVNGPFGSNLLTSELSETGVPVFYIQDVRNGRFERKSNRHVTPDKAKELSSCNVRSGDVLIAKVGDPPGAAAIYPLGGSDGIITQDVVRIRPNLEKVTSEFLTGFMNSEIGKNWLKPIIVEATRSRFGLGEIKKKEFLLPPIALQKEYSLICKKIEASRKCLIDSSAASEKLFSSLSQRAFSDELISRKEAA